MNEIFNSEYKLLGLGFTDDPEGDIAKLRDKMMSAGAEKSLRTNPSASP